MKTHFLLLSIFGLFGQFIALITIFMGETNEHFLNSIYLFLISSIIGIGSMVLDSKLQKNNHQ